MRASNGLLELLRRWIDDRGRLEESRYRIVNASRETCVADRAEIADSGARRKKGLLGRTGLDRGEALWIVPCEAVHTFGMQFAIDLVYVDRRRRVVKTRSGVRPGRLSGCLRAHSVIELPAGAIEETGTRRGDVLVFEREIKS